MFAQMLFSLMVKSQWFLFTVNQKGSTKVAEFHKKTLLSKASFTHFKRMNEVHFFSLNVRFYVMAILFKMTLSKAFVAKWRNI